MTMDARILHARSGVTLEQKGDVYAVSSLRLSEAARRERDQVRPFGRAQDAAQPASAWPQARQTKAPPQDARA